RQRDIQLLSVHQFTSQIESFFALGKLGAAGVRLPLMFAQFTIRPPDQELLPGRTMPMRIDYRRRPNARRYILRINASGDGGCVTIPRGGSWAEARRFVLR